ncbi:intraflagellar transport protein 27 homolog [Pomacea canaliculata]|uniref:intraflagellar transport protein 27 homolog n=1 Tax=Pomacea canaliculata TaxID=400727 RepID=UPI000D725701|nr:intraflagellar transport protein 27 homolog [Pomacea canaliculata]XP_025084927.1 intraflagellar transport protein 27 homolog [Pomacea canaliculata]
MPTILRAKCIVTGDAGVGKSSICQVFHSDSSHFPKNYTMTVGVELLVKPVNIPDTRDQVELFLYDSAGKDVFSEQVTKFWEHPNLVMVVYDVTNEASFTNCVRWLERVYSVKPDVSLPGVLVANKTDLDQRRVVSPKQGKELALSKGLGYFECSAKEMQNIDTPFYYLANEFHKLYQERIQIFSSFT